MRNFLRMANKEELEEGKEDTKIVVDVQQRRISIFCKIDRTATLMMQSILEELKSSVHKDEVITIVLNTEGGSAFQGLAIYDLLKSCGFKLRTVVLGEVASAGVAILLAGDERLMHKNAAIHFHATALQFEEPKERLERSERNILQAEIDIIDDIYKKIYLANSRLTAKKLTELELKEACLTAGQALKLGLVHEII